MYQPFSIFPFSVEFYVKKKKIFYTFLRYVGSTEGLASVKKIVYESTGLRIYKGRQIGSLKNDLSTDLLGRNYSFFFSLLLLLLPRSIVFMYPTRTKTRYIFDFTSHIVFLFLSSFFGYRRTVGRRGFS